MMTLISDECEPIIMPRWFCVQGGSELDAGVGHRDSSESIGLGGRTGRLLGYLGAQREQRAAAPAASGARCRKQAEHCSANASATSSSSTSIPGHAVSANAQRSPQSW